MMFPYTGLQYGFVIMLKEGLYTATLGPFLMKAFQKAFFFEERNTNDKKIY